MAAGKMCLRKSKKETAEWTGLFVIEPKTEQESLVYVKRMMAVALSSITYLRGIFPEDAYKSRYLEDLCVKVLREDCTTPGANNFVKWLMGCFDALEKQYLQIVYIGVFTNPEEPNCIIESYQFKFKYNDRGPEMDILRNKDMKMQVTAEDTKRAPVLLIRKLFVLMQNLDVLPNNVYLTMKLYYYDDITPEEYQPPGFKQGECDDLLFEGTAVNFKVGEVQTAFHSLKVRVSSAQDRVAKRRDSNQQETKLGAQKKLPRGGIMELWSPREKVYEEDELPSEDESAQFKKPSRPMEKRPAVVKKLARKKIRT